MTRLCILHGGKACLNFLWLLWPKQLQVFGPKSQHSRSCIDHFLTHFSHPGSQHEHHCLTENAPLDHATPIHPIYDWIGPNLFFSSLRLGHLPALQRGLNRLVLRGDFWGPAGRIERIVASEPSAVTQDLVFARKPHTSALG